MSADDAGSILIARARYYLSLEYPTKIRGALVSLPADRLWWRPNEHSNSAGNLVLHLAGNVRQWVVSGIGGAPDVRKRDAEFAAREGGSASEVLAVLDGALAEVDRVLGRLTPASLTERREIQGRSTTVLSALFHVVEHFSTHVGQIIYIAKMNSEPGGVRFYDDARNAAPLFLPENKGDID